MKKINLLIIFCCLLILQGCNINNPVTQNDNLISSQIETGSSNSSGNSVIGNIQEENSDNRANFMNLENQKFINWSRVVLYSSQNYDTEPEKLFLSILGLNDFKKFQFLGGSTERASATEKDKENLQNTLKKLNPDLAYSKELNITNGFVVGSFNRPGDPFILVGISEGTLDGKLYACVLIDPIKKTFKSLGDSCIALSSAHKTIYISKGSNIAKYNRESDVYTPLEGYDSNSLTEGRYFVKTVNNTLFAYIISLDKEINVGTTNYPRVFNVYGNSLLTTDIPDTATQTLTGFSYAYISKEIPGVDQDSTIEVTYGRRENGIITTLGTASLPRRFLGCGGDKTTLLIEGNKLYVGAFSSQVCGQYEYITLIDILTKKQQQIQAKY